MRGGELIKSFKEAGWATKEDLRDWVEAASPAAHSDLEKLLSVLTDKKLVAQGSRHRNRCAAFNAVANRSVNRSLFVPFVKGLEQGDAILRQVLQGLIPKANDTGSHDQLTKLLGSHDTELRVAVKVILEQIGGPAALTALTKQVRHHDFAGRLEAIDIMVGKARHRAIPLIVAVIESGAPREQALALRTISDIDLMGQSTRESVDAVKQAIKSDDRRVAGEAFKALGKLLPEHLFFQELDDYIYGEDVDPAVVESLGAYGSQRALDILQHKILAGPSNLRVAAVNGLRTLGTDAAIPLLVEALHADDVVARRRATEVLTELSQEGVVDIARTVLELLKARDPEVRRIAAHLAKAVGRRQQDVAPQLLGFLKDEDWWVRERVMDALVELTGPELTEHITPYLKDDSAVIRRFAIGGLVRLKDAASLGAVLRSAVEDEDWWVREQAVLACAEIGDQRAIPYLKQIAFEREDLRIVALEALQKLKAQAEIVELAELVGDEDPDVRHMLLRCLSEVPAAKSAAFYVQALVNDPDPRVAQLAQDLLARWEMGVEKDAASASLGLLDRMLVASVRSGADDLLLAAGRPPSIKRLGSTEVISKGVLSQSDLEGMLRPIFSAQQSESFDRGLDVDFSYEVKGHGYRYRANVFRQATGIAAVFRNVRQEIPEIEELGLPSIVRDFGQLRQGLVLVGGPTGSGKSTTLAAMLNDINRGRAWHIVTIEDPIEVVHPYQQSLVNQRELGTHTRSFDGALRATLRQDPDAILVGELRDLATIDFAVNAAETGHLVLGTVHTVSADATIDRMVHAYPASQHNLVRTMLAESLRAVVCQQLLRHKGDSNRRILAAEVMINNDAISNLIRKNKSFQIPSMMATAREQGMMLMDQELERLVRQGLVDPEEAMVRSVDKHAFVSMLTAAGYLGEDETRKSLPPGAPPPETPAITSDAPPPGSEAPAPAQWSHRPPPSPSQIPAPGGLPSFRAPSSLRPGGESGRGPAVPPPGKPPHGRDR